jgi:HD superfamily phosphohydrolase
VYRNRYILDPLYGKIIFPDFIWEIIHIPELQRLREVRLCNINSFGLIGGANISRYEHSIGTAYLALQNEERFLYGLTTTESQNYILAALLHDVQSPAFGHSVQNVLDPMGFKHSTLSYALDNENQVFKYTKTEAQQIFFGMSPEINKMLPTEQIMMINDYIEGKGKMGKLINGTMDLDNIDNVYRLSYHIGLVNSGAQALDLARSLSIREGVLTISKDKSYLVHDWAETRKNLYNHLLLNADEFGAQCMLHEALDLAATSDAKDEFFWKHVDYEVLIKLANVSDETKAIISRLMIGDHYGCIGIYECPNMDAYDQINNYSRRKELEEGREGPKGVIILRGLEHVVDKKKLISNPRVALFAIKDVGKTSRKVELRTYDDSEISIGEDARRLLIGIFLKNIDWSMTKMQQERLIESGIREDIRLFLIEKLGLSGLSEINLFSEEK